MDTHLKQAQAAAAPAPNAPALLLAANTTTAPAKSNAAPAQPKPAKPAPTITLPPPDITSSAAPPVITLFARPAGEASPISNLLGAAVAVPKLDTPKVSQTSGGKLIKKVDPIYPSSMALGVHGEVVLKATINRKGQVTKVNIVRGQAVLAQAAVAAVMRWRYEPFLLNGVAIEVESDIVFNFKAPGR
jgi:TonB family protein